MGSIVLSLLIAFIPLAYFWRFRDTPLDRDYTPYAYCGVFKCGYLTNGHVEIKTPLIHWSYKGWLSIISLLRLTVPMLWTLRLLPALSLSVISFCFGLRISTEASLVLMLLVATPTAWPHMAQTEWLTVSLIVLAMVSPAPLNLIALGLLPWANQKNAVLIPFLIWAIGIPLNISLLWLMLPSMCLGTWIIATKRLETFWYHCFILPAQFAKNRKLSVNTPMSLIRGWIWEAAPFMAIMDWHSPWMAVLAVMVIGTIATKQITPQHFIPMALPIAMAAKPDSLPMALIAWAIVFSLRSLLAWRFPSQLYALTFSYAGKGDYGIMLRDADSIEKWLRENTKEGEAIWVNGMENQIYLNANRPAWSLNIPELTVVPEGIPPRIVVHCANSALKNFNYDKWKYDAVGDISRLGLFTILERPMK